MQEFKRGLFNVWVLGMSVGMMLLYNGFNEIKSELKNRPSEASKAADDYFNRIQQRNAEAEAERERDARLDSLAERIRQRKAEGENSGGLTMTAFNEVREGMSYTETCGKLGWGGKLAAASKLKGAPEATTYTWTSGTSVVTCMYLDDKLVTKAQSGLK